jgi:hypothetical protein
MTDPITQHAFSQAYEQHDEQQDAPMTITTTDAIGSIQHNVLIDDSSVGTIMMNIISAAGAVDGVRVDYRAFFGFDDSPSQLFPDYAAALAWLVAQHEGAADKEVGNE